MTRFMWLFGVVGCMLLLPGCDTPSRSIAGGSVGARGRERGGVEPADRTAGPRSRETTHGGALSYSSVRLTAHTVKVSKVVVQPIDSPDPGGCKMSIGLRAVASDGTRNGPAYTLVFDDDTWPKPAGSDADWEATSPIAYMCATAVPNSTEPTNPSENTTALRNGDHMAPWKWRLIATQSFLIGIESRQVVIRSTEDPANPQNNQIEIIVRNGYNALGGGVWVALRNNPGVDLTEFVGQEATTTIKATDTTTDIVWTPGPGIQEHQALFNRMLGKAECLGLKCP